MKIIKHRVFVSSVFYSPGGVRQQAEKFINGIGADNVVSITEHVPILGPFSVVVWWREEVTDTREVKDTDALVIRAADDKQSA